MIPENPTREESKQTVLRCCCRGMELGEIYEVTEFGPNGCTEMWMLTETGWDRPTREIHGMMVVLPLRPRIHYTFTVVERSGHMITGFERTTNLHYAGEHTRIKVSDREWQQLHENGLVQFVGFAEMVVTK